MKLIIVLLILSGCATPITTGSLSRPGQQINLHFACTRPAIESIAEADRISRKKVIRLAEMLKAVGQCRGVGDGYVAELDVFIERYKNGHGSMTEVWRLVGRENLYIIMIDESIWI